MKPILDLVPEFDVELGDPRRTSRLQRVVEAFVRQPEASFPTMSGDPASMEATYRLLNNEALNFENVSAGHEAATVGRCAEFGEVLVVHDTTHFLWPVRDDYVRSKLSRTSTLRQGFDAHYSIAVTSDGLRMPLGTVAMKGFLSAGKYDEETQAFWEAQFGNSENSGDRWLELMAASESRLDKVRVIHVCDREADRNDVLIWLSQNGRQFVLRSCRNTRRTASGSSFAEALEATPFLAERRISLSKRVHTDRPPDARKAHPARPGREALVSFRSLAIKLKLGDGTELPITLVEAVELSPPEGEEPIRWVLMTSEKAESVEEMLRVIDIYRSRWMIEEFFKAIKTGTGYRKRQLDSAESLLIALALSNAVAWRLLALRHLDRMSEDVAASALLNSVQLAILQHETPSVIWTETPTVHEAMRGLARMGGHNPSNGPPGWLILGRALQKLLTMEMGARLAAKLRPMPFG